MSATFPELGSSSHIAMPAIIQPDDNLFQRHLSSSLLWPDSVDFFQSLMSADGMNWAEEMPGMTQAPEIIPDPESTSENDLENQTERNELAAAEDGHRAVQTINGLLTKTVRSREQALVGTASRCRSLCLTYMYPTECSADQENGSYSYSTSPLMLSFLI